MKTLYILDYTQSLAVSGLKKQTWFPKYILETCRAEKYQQKYFTKNMIIIVQIWIHFISEFSQRQPPSIGIKPQAYGFLALYTCFQLSLLISRTVKCHSNSY